jgi:hypothetical protein
VAASGQVVIFLDADDVLEPHAAAAVVAAFAEQPAAARVIFRLRAIDEHGRPSGELRPPPDVPLPNGDVRRPVLEFADDLAWPATSGNAFAAWALARVMPLPIGEAVGADMWLHPLVPLLGPVAALEEPLGGYRIHAMNRHHRARLRGDTSATIVRRSLAAHAVLDGLARELGYGPAHPRSAILAAHRLSSLCLGTRDEHPIRGDSRRRAVGDGLRATIGRTDLRPARRALLTAWFLAAALAPAPAFQVLAEALLLPERRPRVLRRLLRR